MKHHQNRDALAFDLFLFVVIVVCMLALLFIVHVTRVTFYEPKPAPPVVEIAPPVLSEPEAIPSVSSNPPPTFEETDIFIEPVPTVETPEWHPAVQAPPVRKHAPRPRAAKHRPHPKKTAAARPALETSQCEFFPNTMQEQSWIRTYTPPNSLKACQTSSTR